ncbi:MAG: CDP-glycerol glycerophosphotransferase family protein, partial [Erysipelotrichaceae bacterium]
EYLNKRGMNFDYDDITPGYKPNNMKEFFAAISTILKGKDEFQENRSIINDLFNEVKTPCSSNICLNIKKHINEKQN